MATTTINKLKRAKMNLAAYPNNLKGDGNYYLSIPSVNTVKQSDLVELVATSLGNKNSDEVSMVVKEFFDYVGWYLSNGYTVTTDLCNMRVVVKGSLTSAELNNSLDTDDVNLKVMYTTGSSITKYMSEAELNVDINKASTGPQIYSISSVFDSADATDGEKHDLVVGQGVVLNGKKIKVSGSAENVGIVLTNVDSGETITVDKSELYINTPTQVYFHLPIDMSTEGEWQVSLTTQSSSNSNVELKTPRTATLDDTFSVVEV